MSLADEAIKYLKDKQVVVVTNIESEGYLQEIAGVLLSASDGCLVVRQGDEDSPTVVNTAHIAWIYEETSEGENTDAEE